jgi:transketolase
MKSFKFNNLKQISEKLRKVILEMLEKAKSGHPGGSLSSLDLITTLYFTDILNKNKIKLREKDRDLVILSAGHYCPAIYAALSYSGFFSIKKLNSLRKFGSRLLGHPKLYELPGLENSGGSLGQGISLACGYALSLKRFEKKSKSFVYCIMGDGEQNEGQVWEAALFASHNKLNNLICFIDVNKIQIDGFTKDILNTEPLHEKYKSFGWDVIRQNGHDHKKIYQNIVKFKMKKNVKPKIIIMDTIAGKGLKAIEGKVQAHGYPITKDLISNYI